MASPAEGYPNDPPLVVTFVESGVQGGVTRESYRIEEPPEVGSDIVMHGLVTASEVHTSFRVSEPQRKDATPDEIARGEHFSGATNHVRMSIECDHSVSGPPNQETRTQVLGHLGAAMMALKYEA